MNANSYSPTSGGSSASKADVLRLIHLSDFHFCQDHPPEKASILAELAKAVAAERKASGQDFDLVLVTGDIANKGLESEYKLAETWFKETLRQALGPAFPLSHFLFVPGNHDVNRATNKSPFKLFRNQLANTDPSAVVKESFEDPDYRKMIRERHAEYLAFVASFEHGDSDPWWFRTLEIRGHKLGIAGLASSWFSQDQQDKGKLALGAHSLHACLDKIESADLRIAMLHHPLDFLLEAESSQAEALFLKHAHLVLRGHRHKEHAVKWENQRGNCLWLAAGSAFDGTEALGLKHVNGFQILEWEPASGEVRLKPFIYQNYKWIRDRNSYPDDDLGLGRWQITPPKSAPATEPPQLQEAPQPLRLLERRESKIYGRENLLKEALTHLAKKPMLFVFGLSGNGKSSFIEWLLKREPYASSESRRIKASEELGAQSLMRELGGLLKDHFERPPRLEGSPAQILEQLRARYPSPERAWIWIENAHLLLEQGRFRDPTLSNLILALNEFAGKNWSWFFELRERPPKDMLQGNGQELEVPGLEKDALGACLADAAPPASPGWKLNNIQLKATYQWLGGGNGGQAHALATQLLIEVAKGKGKTPYEALRENVGDVEGQIEAKLLQDLFQNVLSDKERELFLVLSLYREEIPYQHLDPLETQLQLGHAFDGLYRRCLLNSSEKGDDFYLHDFIRSWLRSKHLGYEEAFGAAGEHFKQDTPAEKRAQAQRYQAVIADAWLQQAKSIGMRYLTKHHIHLAVEAFLHIIASGDLERLKEIGLELFKERQGWAKQKILSYYDFLFRQKAPVQQQRKALQYAAVLDPEDPKVQRYLGECWQKEEGKASDKALACFEKAQQLSPDVPENLANLGNAQLARGPQAASQFLQRLEQVARHFPQAIDDYVIAIQCRCLVRVGEPRQASELRQARIDAGSRHPAFYNDEAQALLAGGKAPAARAILERAQRNGAADDYTKAILAKALEQADPERASKLRQARIDAGSRNAVFYNDEAQALLAGGKAPAALAILERAQRNGAANDYTEAILAKALEQADPERASKLRQARIDAGSRHSAFYNDEAQALLAGGKAPAALAILERAQRNGAADDYTEAILAKALEQADPERASKLRQARIDAGSRNSAFYADEAQALLAGGKAPAARAILERAQRNGAADDFTEAILAKALEQADPERASKLRQARIDAGSRNPAFYADEAQALLAGGKAPAALAILERAQRNGAANDYTEAILAKALEQADPERASKLRQARIDAGSRDPVFYADEAQALLAGGKAPAALAILERAQRNGAADEVTEKTLAKVRRALDHSE